MKECLNCKKAYCAKRASSKFCSVNCRVLYHQKHGKSKIKPADLQAMFNAVLTAVNSINARNGQPPTIAAVIVPEKPKDAALSYNELRELIEAATSGIELHKSWKEVEKNKELVGWQLIELGKLKELQRTKIDF
jgi:hypothetical protein